MTGALAVTGANSASGRALLRLALGAGGPPCVACVRSERARAQLPPLAAPSRVALIDFAEPASLEAAFAGAQAVVHLPGVLFESARSRYEDVHVASTRAVVAAAQRAGVRKLVLVSALGAAAGSPNRYYATKGEAEQLALESKLPCTVLRAPLLLGRGTEGSAALRRQLAGSARIFLIGGGRHRVQLLDVEDLARAILRASQPGCADGLCLELVAGESLPYRELVSRAARAAGTAVRIAALPALGLRPLLALRTALFGPGFTPDVLDVLLGEQHAESAPAARELGLVWTPLEQTLRASLQEEPA